MRPEDMTTDRTGYSISATNPGTEQAAESAAALAAASIAFQPTDITYAHLCLNHSKSVWDKLDVLGLALWHKWRSGTNGAFRQFSTGSWLCITCCERHAV